MRKKLIKKALHRRGDNIRDKIHNKHIDKPGVILNKLNQKVILILQEQTLLSKVSNVKDGFCFKSTKYDGYLKDSDTMTCNKCESELSILKKKCNDSYKMRNSEKLNIRTKK